jgi:hypothetical protein
MLQSSIKIFCIFPTFGLNSFQFLAGISISEKIPGRLQDEIIWTESKKCSSTLLSLLLAFLYISSINSSLLLGVPNKAVFCLIQVPLHTIFTLSLYTYIIYIYMYIYKNQMVEIKNRFIYLFKNRHWHYHLDYRYNKRTKCCYTAANIGTLT